MRSSLTRSSDGKMLPAGDKGPDGETGPSLNTKEFEELMAYVESFRPKPKPKPFLKRLFKRIFR